MVVTGSTKNERISRQNASVVLLTTYLYHIIVREKLITPVFECVFEA